MLKMHTDQATGAVYYETGCATKEECFGHSNSPVNNGGPAVIGRKRSILVQDSVDNQCVLQCCDDDVCNRECLLPTTTSTTTSTTTTTASPKRNCPPGTEHFDSSCYMFAAAELSNSDAEAFCRLHHGHLVHVDSAAENDFLKRVMTELDRGTERYWIGINDTETENVWKCYDNQKVATFYDWSPGEPDGIQDFDGRVEADCAVYDPFLKFQWRDADCSESQIAHPICELNKI